MRYGPRYTIARMIPPREMAVAAFGMPDRHTHSALEHGTRRGDLERAAACGDEPTGDERRLEQRVGQIDALDPARRAIAHIDAGERGRRQAADQRRLVADSASQRGDSEPHA